MRMISVAISDQDFAPLNIPSESVTYGEINAEIKADRDAKRGH